MAIYHMSAKTIGRKSGRSATAAAAYRSGSEIVDERTGEVHDYARKGGVVHAEIMAPDHAPEWATDRAKLWNEVEQVERRKDAQLCREVVVALPNELPRDRQLALIRDYVQSQFVDRGMVADVAVHTAHEGKHKNDHAHVLLTMRDIGPDGFAKKNRDWNDKALLQEWREQWAERANLELDRAYGPGAIRIDHRTLEAQGIERLPQVHLGPTATAMERKGVQTDRGDLNRLIPEIEAGQKRQAQMQQDLALEREVAPLRAAAEAERQRQVTEQAQQARKAARAAQRQRQAEGLVKEALEAAGGLSGAHEQAKALRESISRLERQGRPQEPPKPLLTPTPDVIPSGHSVATDKARERIPLPVAKGKTLTLAEIQHRAGVASERSFRALGAADKAQGRLSRLEAKPRPDWWRFKARAAHRHQIDQARADLDAKQGQHQQAQHAFERWSRMEQKAEQWLDSNPKVQQHLRGIIEAENAEKLARYEAKMQDHRKAYAEAEPYRAAAKALTPKAEQVEAVALERQMAQERERLAREREEAERRMREATGNESMLDRAKRGDFKQERKGPRRDLGPSL